MMSDPSKIDWTRYLQVCVSAPFRVWKFFLHSPIFTLGGYLFLDSFEVKFGEAVCFIL
jgi:hypothetical protein